MRIAEPTTPTHLFHHSSVLANEKELTAAFAGSVCLTMSGDPGLDEKTLDTDVAASLVLPRIELKNFPNPSVLNV